ncbi:AcrR family transcriptional regulator [Erwinia toletana]|uniref:AcrR family transcriptional regulator n=1 Tax=Winslowiella toletana TaxID=92490 RepID=A0ABS4PDT7_9GAMM|nr:TetR family transcriptional regulator [Winslowiella toletana]MBP2170799.1 AcrR family transcriptional regulator [Winslowiella toletana]
MRPDSNTKKPLRPDAAKRRQAVLAVARRIYAEEGVDVPIQRIATAAGVGRATVHRNFFDRKGLLLALLDEEIDEFDRDLAAVDLRRQPFALFDAFAKLSLTNAALLPQWQAMDAHEREFAEVRKKFVRIVERVLPDVVASGLVRTDLSVQDVELIAGMLGAALRGENAAARAALTGRALDIIKTGIGLPLI